MQLGIVFLILTCMSSCIVTKAVDGGDDSSDDWTAVEKKTLELETKVAGLKTEICALEMKLKEENDEHQNQLKKMSANVSDTMKLVGVQTTDLATLRADVDTLLQELTAATPTPAPADIPACPDNWVEHNGQCLFFSSNTMTWFSAKMNCMYIDAHLAIVDNEDLNTFLKVRLRAPGGTV
ncbi:asialoglycoprotein receptor 1-like [Argopecten irradians]|uniref:asialoglycoprotein receptor 1-like n=1 Tax=Argopecten irradians TaxID=31199 RepID=UPI003719E647